MKSHNRTHQSIHLRMKLSIITCFGMRPSDYKKNANVLLFDADGMRYASRGAIGTDKDLLVRSCGLVCVCGFVWVCVCAGKTPDDSSIDYWREHAAFSMKIDSSGEICTKPSDGRQLPRLISDKRMLHHFPALFTVNVLYSLSNYE